MSKIGLFTIVFVIIVIEIAAGTIWVSKWKTPNARSRRNALLFLIVANLALVVLMLPFLLK